MRLSITKAIKDIMNNQFEDMLLHGCFPEVHFVKSEHERSYYMVEYSLTWSKFAKVVDEKMKAQLDPQLGVFTRKHSASFLEQLKNIVMSVSENEVALCQNRFKTMWD